MPAHMTCEWEQWKLKFRSEGTGIRRFLPIPYFNGSEVSINIITNNKAGEGRTLSFSGTISGTNLDSFETLTNYTSQREQVSLSPKQKSKHKLQFRALMQPGNYSVKLDMAILNINEPEQIGDGRSGHCDIMYFDVLPRDASLTNWIINILMLVLGTVFGAFAGWIAGSIAN